MSGEEKGLLGSMAYVADPPVIDIQGVVANVNLDMISRTAPDTIIGKVAVQFIPAIFTGRQIITAGQPAPRGIVSMWRLFQRLITQPFFLTGPSL